MRIDDEFGVVTVTEGVLELVIHRVADPGDLRAEHSLGLLDMKETLFQCERIDITFALRVRQGLVDVVKLDVLFGVVVVDRLQPGDVAAERWSGQAAEDKH